MNEQFYKKGNFIGQKYEVYSVLGLGGFGVVYLVYLPEMGGVYALKTFRDEFLADPEVRKRFRKEASLWVEMERHPYLVRAYLVDEVSGRLYIGMEFIAPNEEGLNSLEGYLQRRPPDLAQSLRWAIQVCLGMEYAYSKGLRAHRDLKPANIMITQDKIAKVSDFGLAGVFTETASIPTASWGVQPGRIGLSGQTMSGIGFGTPTHMAPEQFVNAAGCVERSDIYSFGIVLYQMAAGGRLPFLARLPRDGSAEELEIFLQAMKRMQHEAPLPRLDSPLFPILERCLEKSPEKRYLAFREVRADLEQMLKHQTGEVIKPPQVMELEAWEWSNKGGSLNNLGRYEESLRCYESALQLDPLCVAAWIGKGGSLDRLGRYDEAIRCYDKALQLDPDDPLIWSNKATILHRLDRSEEAVRLFDRALELDPRCVSAWFNKGTFFYNIHQYEEAIRNFDKALELDPRYADALNNKGSSLDSLGRFDEAIRCFDKVLKIDPRDKNGWYNKGNSLNRQGHYAEAMRCYERVLELDPDYVNAWTNMGICLRGLGRFEEAIHYYDKALQLYPRDPQTWNNKSNCLISLGRFEEALRGYDKALELNPKYANAWKNKGNAFNNLGRYEEAIRCFDNTLQLDPRNSIAWFTKAFAQDQLRLRREAIGSYQEFVRLAPMQYPREIEFARQRLRELGDK